jgi:hypothetical protein
MKIASPLLLLAVIQANVSAFTVNSPKAPSKVVLHSSIPPGQSFQNGTGPARKSEANDVGSVSSKAQGDSPIFPEFQLQRLQGGKTVQTFQLPPWAERAQVYFKTEGRPLRGQVQLWTGPLRTVHTLDIDIEDGEQTPYMATMKFKKLGQILRITSSDHYEFPLWCGVNVPPPEKSDELGEIFDRTWKGATGDQKQRIQGGHTDGTGGAFKYWTVPDDVDNVQIMVWSKETGGKSFKAQVEVLQGPNNPKQKFTLQCGGGTQPYHGLIQTPGKGWTVRIQNKKFVEDGLTEVAVIPYDVNETFQPAPMQWN